MEEVSLEPSSTYSTVLGFRSHPVLSELLDQLPTSCPLTWLLCSDLSLKKSNMIVLCLSSKLDFPYSQQGVKVPCVSHSVCAFSMPWFPRGHSAHYVHVSWTSVTSLPFRRPLLPPRRTHPFFCFFPLMCLNTSCPTCLAPVQKTRLVILRAPLHCIQHHLSIYPSTWSFGAEARHPWFPCKSTLHVIRMHTRHGTGLFTKCVSAKSQWLHCVGEQATSFFFFCPQN